ncbi:MAG: arginase [Pseudomonadales bacterium]
MHNNRLRSFNSVSANKSTAGISLIGAASSLGCPIAGSERAPFTLQNKGLVEALEIQGIAAQWHSIIRDEPASSVIDSLVNLSQQLADNVAKQLFNHQFFAVLGGDHACAIGTWSGVYQARKGKPFGLIWVDAHMDSHTPQSSHSGALHGMPLACLLGHGDKRLKQLANPGPAIQPQNLCLIGVRSFEAEEQLLLRDLGVRVFTMQEIEQRGMEQIMREALHIVTAETDAFGLSIDLDAIDPQLAPAVSITEPGGLQLKDINALLRPLATSAEFIGMEIAEYNPNFEKDGITARLINSILAASVSHH